MNYSYINEEAVSDACVNKPYTVTRRFIMGIHYEKSVVRRFRRCANVIKCTYTNLDSTATFISRPMHSIVQKVDVKIYIV